MRRAFHLLASVAVALMASAGLASAKDSVTIGMVLEPPGLDPTTAPAAAIGSSDALQHLRGPDEDQRGLLGHAAARRQMGLFVRSQDADLHAQAERQVPGRRAVLVQGRQVLLRALRRQGLDQQGQGLLRLDRVRSTRPTRRRSCSSSRRRASRRCFISAWRPPSSSTRRARRPRRPTRSAPGPYKLASWTKGASITLDKWDGFRDPSKIPLARATFRFISDPSAEVAALLAGDVDDFPGVPERSGAGPVQERPALPGADRRHRGQDDPGDEQQEEAARRAQGAAGDRLRDRPQGDHRRGDERSRRADRQPSDAERSRLCRSDRHVSARPGQVEGAPEGGGRDDAARPHPHPAAAGLRAPGRADHRGRARRGRHQRQDPGGRVGAVAVAACTRTTTTT